jgi:hypothetical protein
MILFLLACSGSSGSKSSNSRSPEAIFYSGLEEDATWTYRDDGGSWNDTGYELNEVSLIKAIHTGEGKIEFRRGLRWVDGEPIGSIQLSDSDGLRLENWNLPFGQGEGDFPFSSVEIVTGETVSGDWDCIATQSEEGVSTYYAQYDQVYSFGCSGGGLEGIWSFAYQFGLVRFEGIDGGFLELVAPW